MTTSQGHTCTFIPPWLAELVDGPDRAALDEQLRAQRGLEAPSARPSIAVAPGAAWTVHDAGSTTRLPGTPARSAGEPETGDVAVDEAATGIDATLVMFAEVLERRDYDLHDVDAGRSYIEAYVRFFKFAEGHDHDARSR